MATIFAPRHGGGGQGAPLAPVFHRALVRRLDFAPRLRSLNIGGVANVTFIGPGENLIAPTPAQQRLARRFPASAPGRCSTPTAAPRRPVWTTTPLSPASWRVRFSQTAAESLDRNDCRDWVGAALEDRSVEDGAATLTALTAAAVARIVPLLPRAPRTWIVAGGGARNPTLMRMLAQRLAPARVETGHEAGWSVNSLEAQAIAYLAVRSIRGLPITLPERPASRAR